MFFLMAFTLLWKCVLKEQHFRKIQNDLFSLYNAGNEEIPAPKFNRDIQYNDIEHVKKKKEKMQIFLLRYSKILFSRVYH